MFYFETNEQTKRFLLDCFAEKDVMESKRSFQSDPQLQNHCYRLGCHQPAQPGVVQPQCES